MRSLRTAALGAVAAIAATVLPAVASAASTPTSSLVLMLRPTSDAALRALATGTGPRLTPAQRHARLAALTPSASRVATISGVARDLGLTVSRTSDWSIWASGPSATVAREFGVPSTPNGRTAGRSYPALPAQLTPYVVAALPTSGRVARPLVSHPATRSGQDFRTAYSAPAGGTGAGLSVATVQLSGWNQRYDGGCPSGNGDVPGCDLQSYANRHGIAFDANTQYVATPIDVPPTQMRQSDGQGGDEEVALDQDALLATAPGATQRVYFAPNDDGGAGYVHAIQQVAKDAAAGHIVALSLSWGGCEASDQRGWLASMDQALLQALSQGVTVFAASGDAGSQDCLGEIDGAQQYAPAVDFPASSPYVVGVGGVSLPANGTGPAIGWNGSGGGESSFEPLPSWQFNISSKSRTNHRLVPDIASDADPDNGFVIYDSLLRTSTNEEVLAGTSLASPTQAALLADTLQVNGWQHGLGDIHSALYQGASSGATTDITSDQDPSLGNGDYHSGPGFDLVTGLGTPVWSTLQGWLGQFDIGVPRATHSTSVAINPRAPVGFGVSSSYQSWSPGVAGGAATCDTATSSSPPTAVALPPGATDGTYTVSVAGVTQPAPGATAGSCHVGYSRVLLDRQRPRVTATLTVSSSGVATARWTFADASPSSGLQKFVVTMVANGKTQWSMTTQARYRAFNALPSTRWHLRVTAYDNAGNTATTTAHLLDDTALSFSGGWKRTSSTAAFRRSYAGNARPGASARVSNLVGSTFTVYVRTCSSCGQVGIYDERGHRLAVVDTYASSTHYRVAKRVLTLTSAAKRSFVLKVLSSKNRHSSGRLVGLDALSYS